MRRVADDVRKLFAYFLGMLWGRKEKEEKEAEVAKQSSNNNARHWCHMWRTFGLAWKKLKTSSYTAPGGCKQRRHPFPLLPSTSPSLISFQQPQQAARNEFIYCICKFYTTFCSRCVLPPSLSPAKGVTRVYRCEYLPPPPVPCCLRHVAQKLIRFRYVESKSCQVFVTRSGASSMKPKVFASNTTPRPQIEGVFCVFWYRWLALVPLWWGLGVPNRLPSSQIDVQIFP